MMAAGAKVTFLLVVVLWRGFGYGDAETCEGSKAAYVSSGFPVDDVPDSPIQGKMRPGDGRKCVRGLVRTSYRPRYSS